MLLPQRHTEVLLTRREFEAMIGPAIEETVVALRRAVASAGVRDDEVSAVLLVGGSSRIPLVGQLVGARLGRPIAVDARPKDAICSGAARVAMAAAPSLTPLVAPAAAPGSPLAAQPGPPLEAPGGTADPPPPAPDRDPAARTRRSIAAALATVIVAAAIGIVALTREDGGDATTATTTTTGGGAEDPTTTEGSPSTTTSGSGSGSGDILPLPGDDWSDAARAQFLVDCEAHLGNFLDVGGLDNEATCGCVYDEASSDPAWTFDSFNATWSADDVDPGSDDFRRFMTHLYDCSGLS